MPFRGPASTAPGRDLARSPAAVPGGPRQLEEVSQHTSEPDRVGDAVQDSPDQEPKRCASPRRDRFGPASRPRRSAPWRAQAKAPARKPRAETGPSASAAESTKRSGEG